MANPTSKPRVVIPSRSVIQSVLETCRSRSIRARELAQRTESTREKMLLSVSGLNALRVLHATYSLGGDAAEVRYALSEALDIFEDLAGRLGTPPLELDVLQDYLTLTWLTAAAALLDADLFDRIDRLAAGQNSDALLHELTQCGSSAPEHGGVAGLPTTPSRRSPFHAELLIALKSGDESRIPALATLLMDYPERTGGYPWTATPPMASCTACGTWCFELAALSSRKGSSDLAYLLGAPWLPADLLPDKGPGSAIPEREEFPSSSVLGIRPS